MSALRKAAGALANSVFFRHGRALFAENARNWNLPLSKFDKLWVGAWLILDDYSKGAFPPQFNDRQTAHQAEKDYRISVPGMTAQQVGHVSMAKPFWYGQMGRTYLADFSKLTACLEMVKVSPSAKILELGCGSGWMAEFLAVMGYDMTGTEIAEEEITDANRRIRSLEVKGFSPALKFVATPMESVHTVVAADSFDAVFVFAALHHAFEWREAIRSSFACLKPGGWFVICDEPNVLHIFISYRVAKLSKTHEIGFSKSELVTELRKTGFRKIISTGAKLHWWFRPHWLLAQK